MVRWRLIVLCACAGMSLAGCAGTGMKRVNAADAGFAGTWVGEARPIVTWVKGNPIDISLTIHPDGEISGNVGDAEIVGGKVQPGRNRLVRSLGWGSEYVAIAELKGFIIEPEQIRRKSVNLIFDFGDGELSGGFHTSGSKIGGRRTMKLSAVMTLRR